MLLPIPALKCSLFKENRLLTYLSSGKAVKGYRIGSKSFFILCYPDLLVIVYPNNINL